MSNLSELKIFAGYYITEQQNLTKQEKKTLLEFVKNANENQIQNLLQTGKMIYEKKEILKEGLLSVIIGYLIGSGTAGQYSSVDVGKARSSGYEAGKETGEYFGHKAGYEAGSSEGMLYGAAAAALVAGILTVSYKVYQTKLSKAARACNQYKGLDKQECMVKFKKEAIQAKISMMKKGASKICSKSKNSADCKAKMQQKIAAASNELQSIKK